MSSDPLSSSNKDALMASLMGDNNNNNNTNGAAAEQDLFGDIPTDDDNNSKPQHPEGTEIVPPAAPEASAPEVMAPPPAPSLLMQSGLLGTAEIAPAGAQSGLFDDIDKQEKEEERRRKQEEEESRQQQQQQQEERRRKLAEQEEEQRRLQQQEQEEQKRRQEQEQQRQQQQMQDQMQSIHLGSPPPPVGNVQQPTQQQYGDGVYPQQQQQQYNLNPPPPQQMQQQPPPPLQEVSSGFYRDHQPSMPSYQQMSQQQQPPTNIYQQQQNRYYQPTQPYSTTAGMHNGTAQSHALGQQPKFQITQPPAVQPIYGKVSVSDPLLIQSNRIMGIGQPPYWSYQITTQVDNNGVWLVRRRFRHVVALEDRLREECPGAILPPRPEKHAARAIEEASTQQSAEFAIQRAAELQVYLNQLVQHPVAYKSHVLKLFLALQDDLGTAWPEVSSNALTRLANVGAGAAVKLSDQTATTKFPWNDASGIDEYGEDNAELLALQSSEQVRMGAVLQAVPKLEGAITLLRELAEQKGAVGMELNRLSKEVEATDRELGQPIEIVAGGMLRSGRRSKRLALELSAAMHTFSQQYKLCRYEKMAMQDRRLAIVRRHKERGKADQRAAQLMMQQRQIYQQQPYGNDVGAMERDAVLSDELATDAVREAVEIGDTLKSEINRVAWQRRKEWSGAVKVVASSMKEALTERVAIWESVRESFLQTFPDYE